MQQVTIGTNGESLNDRGGYDALLFAVLLDLHIRAAEDFDPAREQCDAILRGPTSEACPPTASRSRRYARIVRSIVSDGTEASESERSLMWGLIGAGLGGAVVHAVLARGRDVALRLGERPLLAHDARHARRPRLERRRERARLRHLAAGGRGHGGVRLGVGPVGGALDVRERDRRSHQRDSRGQNERCARSM